MHHEAGTGAIIVATEDRKGERQAASDWLRGRGIGLTGAQGSLSSMYSEVGNRSLGFQRRIQTTSILEGLRN